jgi:hypothetical protein
LALLEVRIGHFNPKKHLGEFLLKDQDYARTVITEFARVLLPQR